MKLSYDSWLPISVTSTVSIINTLGLSGASYKYTPFVILFGSILKKLVDSLIL